MNAREVFRKNLNYYLSVSGKMQKDLADYVGAKTTTVSGWTRGVSYPRADAMEKIARFFGVSTSALIGNHDNEPIESAPVLSPRVRHVSSELDELTDEELDEIESLLLVAINNIKKRRKG